MRILRRDALTRSLDRAAKAALGLPPGGFDVILANPPFSGRLDRDRIVEEVKVGRTAQTELLFLRYYAEPPESGRALRRGGAGRRAVRLDRGAQGTAPATGREQPGGGGAGAAGRRVQPLYPASRPRCCGSNQRRTSARSIPATRIAPEKGTRRRSIRWRWPISRPARTSGLGFRDGGTGLLSRLGGGPVAGCADDGLRGADGAQGLDEEDIRPVPGDGEAEGGQVSVDDGQAVSSGFLLSEGAADRPLVDGGMDAHGRGLCCLFPRAPSVPGERNDGFERTTRPVRGTSATGGPDPTICHATENSRPVQAGLTSLSASTMRRSCIFSICRPWLGGLFAALFEVGAGWMLHALGRWDSQRQKIGNKTGLKYLPGEYFARQGWISFDPGETTTLYVAERYGAELFCGPRTFRWGGRLGRAGRDKRGHCLVIARSPAVQTRGQRGPTV